MSPLFANGESLSSWWPDRLLPLVIVLVLVPLVPVVARIIRLSWLAGLKRVPWKLPRATKRIDTALSFARSISYFTLFVLVIFFSIHAVWPDFNPMAATGALSIIALILTGMFKDVVVDVVKGLDILLGGHYDVGDFVEVGGTSGHVIDFQLKYTRLRTPSGEEVVLNNAQCIPSKRFRHGLVTNHISIPLQDAGDEAAARQILDRVAAQVDHQVEAMQDRPTCSGTLPLPATGGVALRYVANVLPGARWVMDEIYVPLIKRSLEDAQIPLSGEISFYYMNDVARFRQLFNRQLSQDEIERWATSDEDQLPAAG